MATPDFAMEEFRALHDEVKQHVDESLSLERYAVGGLAAVYAWILTRPEIPAPYGSLVWSLPILLPLAGGLRSLALYRHIGLIAQYLQRLERELGVGRPPEMGWETFLEKNRRPYRGLVAAVIWLVLLSTTVAGAMRHPTPSPSSPDKTPLIVKVEGPLEVRTK